MNNKIIFTFLFCIFFITQAQYANAQALVNDLAGQILLQVEGHGEAWYVDPVKKERRYLGRPRDAFKLMREIGLGISNKDIKKIPIGQAKLTGKDFDKDGLTDAIEDAIGTNKMSIDSDGDGYEDTIEVYNNYNPKGKGRIAIDYNLINRLKGKILLQVENKGEAWYLNPKDRKRYFLSSPRDAFAVMRKLGLGISNQNLVKIPEPKKAITVSTDSVTTKGQKIDSKTVKKEKKVEQISIKSKSLTPSKNVFKKVNGSLIGLFEIKNTSKQNLIITNLQTNLKRANSAPKISEKVYLVNSDTGNILATIEGDKFSFLNSIKITNTNLKPNKTFNIAIITNFSPNTRDNSSYQVAFTRLFFTQNNKQIVKEINKNGARFYIKQTNIIAFKNNDFQSQQYIMGQTGIELARFNIEAIGNKNLIIDQLNISSTKEFTAKDFSKLYLYIGNQKFGEINSPRGKIFKFKNKGTKIKGNSAHTITLKGNSKSTISINALQFLISDIKSKSENQKVATVFSDKQTSKTPAINFNKSEAGFRIARLNATVHTNTSASMITSFFIKNKSSEDIKLEKLYLETTENFLSNNLGYSNLKVVNSVGKTVSATIDKPLTKNNTISLNNTIVKAGKEARFNVVTNISSKTPTGIESIKIKNITATGVTSKIRIPISFSEKRSTEVIIKNK